MGFGTSSAATVVAIVAVALLPLPSSRSSETRNLYRNRANRNL
jgi:hypothetical protein